MALATGRGRRRRIDPSRKFRDGRARDGSCNGKTPNITNVRERAAILGAGHTLDVRKALGPVGGPAPAPAPPALGVNPFTLRSRLRRLGIDWSRFRE